jgi:proteasome lid subunit RPN8/RPN11
MANQVRAQLQRTKQLSDGAELYYRVLAFLDEEETERHFAESSNLPSVTTSSIALGTANRRRFQLVDTWDNPSVDDLPVLVDLGVIEEIVEETRRNPACEIAGFLLGHLQRDERTQEVYVVVTGLVSATGTTEASSTSVTYTPSSFALARQIMKLRSAGELIIGWFHSHPFKLCSACPLPTPPECIAKILFYSLDDVDLMQSTFQLPYMVGLLAAVDARIEQAVGHLPVRLYGWCNGEIKPRGFDVVRVESNEPASI